MATFPSATPTYHCEFRYSRTPIRVPTIKTTTTPSQMRRRLVRRGCSGPATRPTGSPSSAGGWDGGRGMVVVADSGRGAGPAGDWPGGAGADGVGAQGAGGGTGAGAAGGGRVGVGMYPV